MINLDTSEMSRSGYVSQNEDETASCGFSNQTVRYLGLPRPTFLQKICYGTPI